MIKEIQTILAVGSNAIDTIQTPNGNRNNILGGSATYFSLSASLFAPVKLVGVVGTDFPEKGWQLFSSNNINIDAILEMGHFLELYEPIESLRILYERVRHASINWDGSDPLRTR